METILPVENETLLEIEKLTNLRFETVQCKVDQTSYQYYVIRVSVIEDDGTRINLYLRVQFFLGKSVVHTKEECEADLVRMLSTGEYGFVRFPRPDEKSRTLSIPVNIGLPTFSTVEELRMKLALREAR